MVEKTFLLIYNLLYHKDWKKNQFSLNWNIQNETVQYITFQTGFDKYYQFCSYHITNSKVLCTLILQTVSVLQKGKTKALCCKALRLFTDIQKSRDSQILIKYNLRTVTIKIFNDSKGIFH